MRFAGVWSSRCPASQQQTPRRGRRDTSTERDLTEAREAHQKAIATMAALEEEIERLSQSVTQG